MIDSGAQGNYISPSVVNKLRLPWKEKQECYRLSTVDGANVEYGNGLVDMETAPLHVEIHNLPPESIIFDITGIAKHQLILGIPWLKKVNPRIDWNAGQLFPNIANTEKSEPEKETPRRDLASAQRSPEPASKPKTLRTICYIKATKPSTPISIQSIPEEYRRYDKLFQEELETGLPEHSQWDCEIPLIEGQQPKFHKIYPLNPTQSQALKEYLEENLRKGYIRPSTSPAGYPILFVPKKNGKLRLCVDYRQLNQITIKNRYPLPLIAELRDQLKDAQWFTTLDLKGAYNLIRIKEGEEWKTAFRTNQGHFEYLVMPFGLTNAPASFQTMIDHVLREYINVFVVVYLDDILIYSKDLESHKQHVHKVLKTLQDAKLLAEPEKCRFHQQEVNFLGNTIKPGSIQMEASKIAAIRDWPEPTNVTGIRGFLGYTNFYRKYIAKYGDIARPLTDLTKNDVKFEWTDKQQKAFDTIKAKVLEDPILMNANPEEPYEVEADASDWCLGGQLNQKGKDGKMHPIAFFSKKLHGPELNYQIHDKELMAIIEAFKEWKHYLMGAKHQIKVYTDHKNLAHFLTTKELNKRQIRWAEFLSEFDLEIIYRKGSENGRADALSRRIDMKTEVPPETQSILRKNEDGNMVPNRVLAMTYSVQPDKDWEKEIQEGYKGDTFANEWEKHGQLESKGEFYTYQKKIYVPKELQEETIRRIHEAPAHGHQGIRKTDNRLKQTYDFPGRRTSVEAFINKCEVCARSKTARHKPYGELKSIPAPAEAWKSVAIDFIVKLPPSKDHYTGVTYDSIAVTTERLTKYAKFIPWKEDYDAPQLARIFLKEVVALHGLPDEIISDRGSVFISKFWKSLTSQLGAHHKLSTSYHPQTDGQTERANQTLETYLRSYVNYDQNNWVELLPMAQFAYNSATSEATGMTPFYANFGYELAAYREPRQGPKSEQAMVTTDKLKALHKQLQAQLQKTNEQTAKYYNKKRLKGPIFERGDKVYLDRKNIKTKRPSSKLDFKKLGPFKIEKKISDTNYKLSLPKGMKIHPVFHISLLEPAPKDARLQTDVETEDNNEYEVEQILNKRTRGTKTEYLIKWKGYAHAENTWEPEEHLGNAKLAIAKYNANQIQDFVDYTRATNKERKIYDQQRRRSGRLNPIT
jgi:hypothetical protein